MSSICLLINGLILLTVGMVCIALGLYGLVSAERPERKDATPGASSGAHRRGESSDGSDAKPAPERPLSEVIGIRHSIPES